MIAGVPQEAQKVAPFSGAPHFEQNIYPPLENFFVASL
jgi:hypothetical protein